MQSGSGQLIENDSQEGSGLLNNFLELAGLDSNRIVEQIAEFVVKKLNPALVPEPYQNYNLGPPAQVSTENPNTRPPLAFAISHPKDDLNDKYDEVHLLKTIAPKFRRQAQILLKEFDKRPNQITWTGDGTLLIDQVSIPKSNIFVIFPLLFKASKRAIQLPGFEDLVLKINEIGLDHLIKCKVAQPKFAPKKSVTSSLTSDTSKSKTKWWFLG